MNPRVDWYFEKSGKWQKEFQRLRKIALDCDLVEELKWGHPCYTFEKRNVVLIHGFKEYCALLFFNGALLKDPKRILVQQTQNVQAARQVRFTDLQGIAKLEPSIKKFIYEAAKLAEQGAKVPLKKTSALKMPVEFRSELKSNPALKKAFDALTPGRQRGYLLYFSSAIKPVTRESRIRKYVPKILNGKGLED